MKWYFFYEKDCEGGVVHTVHTVPATGHSGVPVYYEEPSVLLILYSCFALRLAQKPFS